MAAELVMDVIDHPSDDADDLGGSGRGDEDSVVDVRDVALPADVWLGTTVEGGLGGARREANREPFGVEGLLNGVQDDRSEAGKSSVGLG
eukprot:2117893-Alexandrium_andersonii.AAC.1